VTIAASLHYIYHKAEYMRSIIFLFVILFTVIACSSDNNNDEKRYLKRASGNPGDILLVMDSVQWRGELGKEVRKIFQAPVPGLPQVEPMFNIIWIHPSKSITLLTELRNVVYVFTLDQKSKGSKILRQGFSPETLEKIRTDSSFNLSTRHDEFSKGQEVMYLFGQTERHLTNYLRTRGQAIIDFFNTKERCYRLSEDGAEY
jgi:hypothetical protein